MQKIIFVRMRKVYLLTTAHLEDHLWFREEEDFRVGMNYVAIESACRKEVGVLAFVLMSNHLHFVLRGYPEDVLLFVHQVKRRYSQYFRKKYGAKEFLRGNEVDIREVPYEDEAVERAVAYVQMNPVAANICSHPSQYPWGSGNCFFCVSPPGGRPVREFSVRSLERMMHSFRPILPPKWKLSPEGYILPSSYLDIEDVETIFRTPKRMNFFLSNSSKARKRMESVDAALPAFRDQTILTALPELCRSLFGKETFNALQADEQVELARQLRLRFSTDANQIARVCGLTYADAARLLDRF